MSVKYGKKTRKKFSNMKKMLYLCTKIIIRTHEI